MPTDEKQKEVSPRPRGASAASSAYLMLIICYAISMLFQKVLIIIPTYNEAENIESLLVAIEKITKRLRQYTVDILVVDDRSPDGTGKIVERLDKKYRNIRLLSGNKAGLGKAYIRGLAVGLQNHVYDIIIMMDADGSHDPSYIPRFLHALEQGYDYVIGSRYIKGGAIPQDWSILRRLNSLFGNLLARNITGLGSTTTDATSGYKAARTDVLRTVQLEDLHVSGFFFQVALTYALTHQNGARIRVTEIPILFANRQRGVSKMGLRDILEFVYCSYVLNPHAPAHRFVRFCLVGLSGVIVNIGSLAFFVSVLQLQPVIGSALAIETSIFTNFCLNHRYTFYDVTRASGASLLVRFVKFNIFSLASAATTLAAFTALYKFAGLYYLVAQALAILPGLCFNFWASTKVVWKAR